MTVPAGSAVRCPTCDHLIACRTPDGRVEVKYSNRVRVWVVLGEVFCTRCNTSVLLRQLDAAVRHSVP